MATIEDLNAAERRMNEAFEALRSYNLERRETEALDPKRQRRLADELHNAVEEYVRVVSELRGKTSSLIGRNRPRPEAK
jgi:hypothetical protein